MRSKYPGLFTGKTNFGFYRLEVWQLGMSIVGRVYSATKKFPSEEKFGLTSQLRRAAVSVPLNIAEGSAKRTKKDFAHYVRTALGSLMEIVTCLEITLQQCYLQESDVDILKKEIEELYFKLIALDKSLTSTT